jgi:hypothetical protein
MPVFYCSIFYADAERFIAKNIHFSEVYVKISKLLIIALLFSAGLSQAAEPLKNRVLKSILLPGWGELSMQEPRGRWLMAADLAMLASIIGLQSYSSDQDREMKSYALLHANAAAFSDANQYWIDMGSYLSWQLHQESMLESRTPEKVWDEAYAWEWSSVENANRYRAMRRSRDLAKDRSTLFVGAMVFNRIVSALDVLYLSNRNAHLSFSFDANHQKGQLCFSKTIHIGR